MPQYFGKPPAPSWSSLGAISEVEVGDRQITFSCGQPRFRIQVLTPQIIRVRLTPTGKFLPRRSWAVTLPDEEILADESLRHSESEAAPMVIEQTDQAIALTTPQLRVEVQRQSGQIAFYTRQGQAFASDSPAGMNWQNGRVTVYKQMADDEHFYGFGERTGLLDQRSQKITQWTVDAIDYDTLTDEMYQAIPFFLSLRPGLTYGVFLNSTYRTQFDLGYTQSDQWQMTVDAANDPALESAPELDYYLIYGSTPAEILHHYTRLTGRMPMPPKWALGYHQSRWSYESEPVVRAIAQEFRSRQLPCDVIHLDIDYMQDYRVFTWNADRFPNPAKLIQELQQAGFKVVTIVDPGIKFEPEGDYWVYQEALQKDYLICSRDGELFQGYVWSGKTVFPDFMRPEVRDWWGNGQRILTEMGVAGIWNDMNEPALNDRPFGTDGKKIPFPLDALQGPVEAAATHTETHNLYGFKMAQASYEGLGKLRSNQRSFVLTRSGYAGIQRWSSVWTGDNHSRWEHLEMSLPMLCNLGLSGVAFCGADIGGFAGNATPELFARWMQVGMLYPLMRGHSAMTCIRQEPWAFGEPVESICRTYLELRYQLLPYFYTLFWEAAKTGAPILRPLLYHYPDDPKTYTIHDQVLLGANLMAAPIYRPGQDCRAVYLPEGTWYDWWTGDRHQGSKTILVDAPLDQMPLFAKAGTILPLQPVSQFVDEQFLPALRLWVWPGTGEFTLYEDDGNTLEYQTGAWSTRTCRVYQTERQIIVAIAAQQGQWAVENRELVIELVGYGEQRFLDQGDAIEAIFEQR